MKREDNSEKTFDECCFSGHDSLVGKATGSQYTGGCRFES